jgi:parallel beta-helix repeat protein
MILVGVLVLGAITGLMAQFVNNEGQNPSEIPEGKHAGTLYASHGPISINGNGDFTIANGVASGSGMASDPYIISDWDINASSSNGISIESTDSHFIIRNCYVHGGSSDWIGIYLYGCRNGTLENNDFSSNSKGIHMVSSSNMTLSNNTCGSNYADGIYLDYSSGNMLSNNTCSNNGKGMYLGDSSHNTIIKNNCSSNVYEGMYLDSMSSNNISDNNCSSNGHEGIRLDSSCSNDEISRNLISNNIGCGVNISSASDNHNRIWNNTFIGNNGATGTYELSHVQAFDDGAHNWWNSTSGYGNHWNDWQSPDDVLPYGIVDLPYNIPGSAGAVDNYPLTMPPAPIPEFGMMPFVVIAFLVITVLAGEMRLKKKP